MVRDIVRENKGITVVEVYQRTGVPVHIISKLISDGVIET